MDSGRNNTSGRRGRGRGNNSGRGSDGQNQGRGRGRAGDGQYQPSQGGGTAQRGRGRGGDGQIQPNQAGGRGRAAQQQSVPPPQPQQFPSHPPMQSVPPLQPEQWPSLTSARSVPAQQQQLPSRPPMLSVPSPQQQQMPSRPPMQPVPSPQQQQLPSRPPMQSVLSPQQQQLPSRPPMLSVPPPQPQQWPSRPPMLSVPSPQQQQLPSRPPMLSVPSPQQQQSPSRPPMQSVPSPQQPQSPHSPVQSVPPRPLTPAQTPAGGVVSWAAITAGGKSSGSGAQTPTQSAPSSSTKPVLALNPRRLSDSLSSLSISKGKQPIPSPDKGGKLNQPIRRPDKGGEVAIRSIKLVVNHFLLKFDKDRVITHYNVDVKFKPADGGDPVEKSLRKSEARLLRDLFVSGYNIQLSNTAYDGGKNIFSAIPLPEGEFDVQIPEGEDMRSGIYVVKLRAVNDSLKLSTLNDYIQGNLHPVPRDVLQGMDLVMKENPVSKSIPVGGRFFSSTGGQDLRYGLEAVRGYNQSLKPTSQGVSLCLDYSILSFRKQLFVIDFLKQHIEGFKDANDVTEYKPDVQEALKGLLVNVTHRPTKQKYTVTGLTDENCCDCHFDYVDPKGENSPRKKSLLDYFREKWGKEVLHPDIPCLELGRNQKSNKVPMEFCKLVAGQRFPKEGLEKIDKDAALILKKMTLDKPLDRRGHITAMVKSPDGPSGDTAKNFGFELDEHMTKITGRVIGAPELRIGPSGSVKVDHKECKWSLHKKSFVESKSLDRWALIDFTNGRLKDTFVRSLIERCWRLGIEMEQPLVCEPSEGHHLSSVKKLQRLLNKIVEKAGRIKKEKLQMIVCVMAQKKESGYKALKWVSETKIGVVTQCCWLTQANQDQNKGQDQYLANLCLKINAKLGGNNFEVKGKLLNFPDHVMFIGADVNHPAPTNKSCPSIAAVVGSVNWPAANRYAARVRPQTHRCEKINDFGEMCLDLINTYKELNNVKPKRIIVFRDGVSEGQFDMVLGQELVDLKRAIDTDDYQPRITVIVAQKRHQTRLFVENKNDGGQSGNVPPGTVVDTKIVHPQDFDFYLCSHYGGIGTSKPTHYYVLWDENNFSSDQLQKLIYEMCFTFVRCTKPVSLVPPVYYADLVAYRGRMFQEAIMENDPSEGASFDQTSYTLHHDLQNTMFFV